jgi:DNA-binding transcriptional regulator YdaS (Cro superfamily)
MDKLLAYINSLSPDERERFAADAKTSIGYLRKAISTKQKLGEALCMDIERASKRAVTCEDLRPDLAEQWAYLRGTKSHKKAA